MSDLKTLKQLFSKKLFTIPNYQRGYAWDEEQLLAFWEDLIHLQLKKPHYTGQVVLKEQVAPLPDENEYWLVDSGYKTYEVVDGQQRLLTIVILLQALIEHSTGLSVEDVDGQSIKEVKESYLYKEKPPNLFRTYKVSYDAANDTSYAYMDQKIFNGTSQPELKESSYTRNLAGAKQFFAKKLSARPDKVSLDELYRKLTTQFMFHEHVIGSDFNIFVAFETINNRGKRLSSLELLKNRLIYLTTLYGEDELDKADVAQLQKRIDDVWGEIYRQLGRSSMHGALNDDDFLRAHWIMYFDYSRHKKQAHVAFLLDTHFSPRRVSGDSVKLKSDEIKKYIDSLERSAPHWCDLHYPSLAVKSTDSVVKALESLNRVGIGYFRPLIMSILINVHCDTRKIELIHGIERLIFIVFRLCHHRGNYKDSFFYGAAHHLHENKEADEVDKRIKETIGHDCRDGIINSRLFKGALDRRFEAGKGYYRWAGLEYLLFEYDLHLRAEGHRGEPIQWESPRGRGDQISIEHIFPQQPKDGDWVSFTRIPHVKWPRYAGSLGNLLLLSLSINSSLQNDGFKEKRKPKYTSGGKLLRTGYAEGSASEQEVAGGESDDWTPEKIRQRGLKILEFMEKRWEFGFQDESTRIQLLFLDDEGSS